MRQSVELLLHGWILGWSAGCVTLGLLVALGTLLPLWLAVLSVTTFAAAQHMAAAALVRRTCPRQR